MVSSAVSARSLSFFASCKGDVSSSELIDDLVLCSLIIKVRQCFGHEKF